MACLSRPGLMFGPACSCCQLLMLHARLCTRVCIAGVLSLHAAATCKQVPDATKEPGTVAVVHKVRQCCCKRFSARCVGGGCADQQGWTAGCFWHRKGSRPAA